MALEIGGGITIGGGISVIESTSESVIPNSFTVGYYTDGSYTYEGAYVVDPVNSTTQLGSPDFGTITSDYIYGIFHQTNSLGQEVTSILLKEGSYSGFNVFNGVIGSDLVTYPRVFTVDGTSYIFYLGSFGYHAQGDILSLASAMEGSLKTALYNPNLQISLTPDTIIVGSRVSGYETFYGANRLGDPYGVVVSDYIDRIAYSPMTGTALSLKDGTYTGFSVTGGAIDGDTSNSTRKFTINNTEVTFTCMGNAPYMVYVIMNSSDALNLQSLVGETIPVLYDPNAQTSSGTGYLVSGTITVANNYGISFGWQAGTYGSSTLSIMGPAIAIRYDSAYPRTEINFLTGTYAGVVIDNNTVGGETNVTVVIDGITEVLTMDGNGNAIIANDPFGLENKVGQTLDVTITPGSSNGASVFTSNVDYNNGSSSPPGMFISGPGPYTVMLDPTFWTNSAGYALVEALTSGDTFDVTMPMTGNTAFTLTLTQSWSGSPYKTTQVTSSSPLTLDFGTNSVPTSITLPAPSNSVTYTGWPLSYGQGVYMSGNNLQINSSSNASELWAVYGTLTTGTPISFVIDDVSHSGVIGDPATGGGGPSAPYITVVPDDGNTYFGNVSSVTIG